MSDAASTTEGGLTAVEEKRTLEVESTTPTATADAWKAEHAAADERTSTELNGVGAEETNDGDSVAKAAVTHVAAAGAPTLAVVPTETVAEVSVTVNVDTPKELGITEELVEPADVEVESEAAMPSVDADKPDNSKGPVAPTEPPAPIAAVHLQTTGEDPIKERSSGAASTEGAKSDIPSGGAPLQIQKASFNVDAKPFSPNSFSDPAIQGTLVGEANGVSIKVGQWSTQQYLPLKQMTPTAAGVHPRYVAPMPAPRPLTKKELITGKESLSAFAKPWSPHPEAIVPPAPVHYDEVAIHPGSWVTCTVDGREVQAPAPMVPREEPNNLFTHSFSIHPKGLRTVELDLFNYACARCQLKTLYGRLSSRQPDVTMRNVSMDVPPLCVAHLIEQVTKTKVTALCVNEMEGTHYDVWLEKPNSAATIIEQFSKCVWTCPMHHGFAVVGKGEEGRKYLRNYVDRLRDAKPEDSNVYDVSLVEVNEH